MRGTIGSSIRGFIKDDYKRITDSIKHYHRGNHFGFKHARDCYVLYKEGLLKGYEILGKEVSSSKRLFIRMSDRFYKIKNKGVIRRKIKKK